MTLRLLLFLLLAGSAFGANPKAVAPQAIITDIHGQPLPAELPLGEAVVFSARTSVADDGSAMWTILPEARDKRKYVSPDGLDVFVPIGRTNVNITAILSVSKIVDGKSKSHHTVISVKCGEGDLPPPIPDPKPDPQPQPADRVLSLVVFTDKASVDPDFAKLTNSTYWHQLSETHRVATFFRSTQDIAGKAFLDEVDTPSGNVLLIREDGVRRLACVPLPKTVEAFKAEVAKWSKR